MQDVTSLPFMKVVHRRGVPDFFFTEFSEFMHIRRLTPDILTAITENPSNQPVFAQLIGENNRCKKEVMNLKNIPADGIDLNLGCPAPRVFKKCGRWIIKNSQKNF